MQQYIELFLIFFYTQKAPPEINPVRHYTKILFYKVFFHYQFNGPNIGAAIHTGSLRNEYCSRHYSFA